MEFLRIPKMAFRKAGIALIAFLTIHLALADPIFNRTLQSDPQNSVYEEDVPSPDKRIDVAYYQGLAIVFGMAVGLTGLVAVVLTIWGLKHRMQAAQRPGKMSSVAAEDVLHGEGISR